jgi:hypothetical protein
MQASKAISGRCRHWPVDWEYVGQVKVSKEKLLHGERQPSRPTATCLQCMANSRTGRQRQGPGREAAHTWPCHAVAVRLVQEVVRRQQAA